MSVLGIPQTFVPWSEGAHRLGLKRSAFFSLVKSGQIRVEPGRGPRDGRYSVEDIEAIKARRAQGKTRKPHRKRLAPVFLDWLSPDNIPAILKLDKIVYDEMFLAEAAVYHQWSEKNPHFFMAPRYDLADNAYMLDLARPSASKIIRWFQAMIAQKAPLPAELRRSYTPDPPLEVKPPAPFRTTQKRA